MIVSSGMQNNDAKELEEAQRKLLDYLKGMSYPNIRCIVCGKPLENYCTQNVCKNCCETGQCPTKMNCVAYPEILEKVIKRLTNKIVENPSERVRI